MIPPALVDSLNPARIAIAVCLTVVDRPAPALRPDIAAIYVTYFLIRERVDRRAALVGSIFCMAIGIALTVDALSAVFG